MHIAEVVTIAKSLPLLRLNTYKSLILSYSADYRRIFRKNKEGKASDIRKIHGSHKTIPMERKCQEVKEYGKKMFSCYGGGKYWTINLCRCRCWNYLKIRGIILDWT